jgi:hypothetical protein
MITAWRLASSDLPLYLLGWKSQQKGRVVHKKRSVHEREHWTAEKSEER